MADDWRDALAMQQAVYSWCKTNPGIDYMATFFRSVAEKNNLVMDGVIDDVAGPIVASVVMGIGVAPTFFLSDEMRDASMRISESMPGEEMMPEDMPSQYGFMVLQSPTYMREKHGLEFALKAISWQPAVIGGSRNGMTVDGSEDGFAFSFWTDDDDLKEQSHPLRSLYASARSKGIMPRLVLSHFTPWPKRATFDDAANADAEAARIFRFLAATFRLMQQEIFSLESHRPERGIVRSWRRAFDRGSDEFPNVNTIRLRRVHRASGADSESGSEVEWSHRWIVRGHWRRQWYASEGRHKSIWIEPFAKGPEDKPLIVKTTVFRVDR